MPIGPKTIDISGQRFGNLIVLGLVGREARRTVWLCQCDCGRQSEVRKTHLTANHTTSCGCNQKRQQTKGFNRSHGLRSRPEYGLWADMKQRCTNPTRSDYERYGLRGISVCQSWLEDFAAFFKDMGPRPSPKHTIERIDNAKAYEPSNCRWATVTEQNNNKRSNRIVEAFGKQQTCAQWAREIGMDYGQLLKRLERGISPEAALTAPKGSRKMDGRQRAYAGEKSSNAKLNGAQVISIREAYAAGATQTGLAQSYAVSASQIHNIVRFKRWVTP